MPAVSLPGLFTLQMFTDAGAPMASGRLYTFAPGTTTKKLAYTESTGTTAHTYATDGDSLEYIALNARGELPAPLFLQSGGYDIVLKDSSGATEWTRRAFGLADAASTTDTTLRADLADVSTAGKGDALTGWGAIVSIVDGVLTRHASLAAAVSSISSTRCTVVVRDDVTMAASATFPLTATLRVENGARITTTGYTLTARIEAPAVPIFSGTGTVVVLPGSGRIVPQWWGAVGDAATDDYAAIQAAGNAAMTARAPLWLPAPTVGSYYQINTALSFDAPLSIFGEGPHGVTLWGQGLSAGQHVIDFNCVAGNNVENVTISGLTIRSNNGTPNGLRLKNVSQVQLDGVRFYGLTDGLTIEGTRCFTHTYNKVEFYSISSNSVAWDSSFSGGGQFVFAGCTFVGSIAVDVPAGALIDNLSFTGCNWEQHTSNGLRIAGTCGGVSVVGCRTEGGDGIDIVLRPSGASEYVGGVNIAGNVFGGSDAAASARIQMGGDSGKIRGFAIVGNVVAHGTDEYATHMVHLNGDGESGLIAGNYIRGTDATGAAVVNTRRAGVLVFGNENLTGKLPEHRDEAITTITYSASMTPDAGRGEHHTISATNTTAFTINAPTNTPPSGRTQDLTLTIRNASGGALGTITWNSVFKLASWTSPANNFSRSITFRWDGTNWVETGRTAADVPV